MAGPLFDIISRKVCTLIFPDGRSDGYHCTGNLSEWTKCSFMTRAPKRVAFKIPKVYNDVAFLKSYKYQKKERLFNKATLAASSINHQSLKGVKFFVQGQCDNRHIAKLVLPTIPHSLSDFV